MRTTLTVDDDVFFAAKALAAHQRRPVGQVISELARRALHEEPKPKLKTRNGIPLWTRDDKSVVVTMELVNALRDEGE